MSIAQIAAEQYKMLVNTGTKRFLGLTVPPEGWLRTVRKSLNMSGAQLARALGVTRAGVSQAEKAELSGGITLKTLQHMAEAMDCRLVYAIVPERRIEDVIKKRARQKAKAIVERASEHMALEGQMLSSEQLAVEVRRVEKQLFEEQPRSLWEDE